MRFEFGALPWGLLGQRPVMITLTYPGDWEVWVPDARTFVRHREALKERWRRKFGPPVGVWVAEFQRRGAPHLHLYLALPDVVTEAEYSELQQRTIRRRRDERLLGPYEARRRLRAPNGDFALWLRTAWWEVVGSELRAHHGRGADIATAFFSEQAEASANRVRVAEYFWRESGKWAQKNPPEGFGSLKFYGRWGKNEGFNPVVTTRELDERAGLELRRMLRRLRAGKMQEAALRTGRRVSRTAGRSRGRDGLTVFNVDGTAVGPRLRECAEQLALEKAAASFDREVEVGRLRPELIRAFSEVEVVDELDESGGDRGWADYVDWQVLEAGATDAAIDAAIAQARFAQEAQDAPATAQVEEMKRETRQRPEVRRLDGRNGSTRAGRGGAGRGR